MEIKKKTLRSVRFFSFPVFVLILLGIGVAATVGQLQKQQTTNTQAQVVSGCQVLTLNPSKNINGYTTDQYVWFDSGCKARSASLVKNTQQDPTGRWGGYMQQYTYDLGGSTRTVNGGNFWAGGFGYLVNHWGSGATLSANSKGTSTSTILNGAHHKIHEYKMQVDLGGPVDATVQWFFATGRDNPVWTVTYDATPAGPDTAYADTRSPYGDMDWDGGAGANVSGVGWGDHFKFKTLSTAVTDQSGWDYSEVNTVPYVQEWVNNPDAEMGTVQTQTYQQHDAGSMNFFQSWGTVDNNGPMPEDWNWPYQLNQYEMGSSPTASKRLAWGMNYGAVGQRQVWPYGGANPTLSGYPYQSYSVYVVLDKHTKNPVLSQVTQVENMQRTTLSATIGSIVTQGAAGVARADTVTYQPPGYNHIYGTFELNADTQSRSQFSFNPNGGTLKNPVFVIHNYSSTVIPQTITVAGSVRTKDIDFFPSLDTANKVLWLTIPGDFTASTQVTIDSSGAPTGSIAPTSTPTNTPSATPTPTLTPIRTPTPTIVVCPRKTQGDADCNGIIDIIDLSILGTTYTSTTDLRADFSGNGVVDIFDLSILESNFGT